MRNFDLDLKNNYEKGPIISDSDFFSAINLDLEGLSKLKSFVQKEDYDNAKRELFEYLISHIRESDKPLISVTEENLDQAERILSHELTSVGQPFKFGEVVDWYSNPTYNQYKEWTWQLSRHKDVAFLAEMYRATGDERYAECVVDLIHSWIKQAVRPEAEVDAIDTKCWRTIECGIRMYLNWKDLPACVYKSKSFTPDFAIDFLKSVYEHAIRLETHFTLGNWLTMELNGLLTVATLYPFFKKSSEWIKICTEKFITETDGQVHDDGFQCELATGYHELVIDMLKQATLLLSKAGYPVPEQFLTTMKKMIDVDVKLVQSDHRLPCINDGEFEHINDELVKFIDVFPDDEVYKWFFTDGKEGHCPDYLSIILENSGIVALRNGWEKDAVTAIFDCGKLGKSHRNDDFLRHHHEDKLNLIISAFGKELIIEGNIYAYDTSKMRRYVLSSFAHNVICVNGMGQNRRAEYEWSPSFISSKEKVDYSFSDELDVVSAVYDEGFGDTCERIAKHGRKVVFVKNPKFGAPYFIVTDTVTSDKENDYETIWHMNGESATVDGNRVCFDGGEIILLSGFDSVKIVKGQEEPVFQGFTSYDMLQGCYRPCPTLLVNKRAKDNVAVTVISPIKDAPTIKSAELCNDKIRITYMNGEFDEF